MGTNQSRSNPKGSTYTDVFLRDITTFYMTVVYLAHRLGKLYRRPNTRAWYANLTGEGIAPV